MTYPIIGRQLPSAYQKYVPQAFDNSLDLYEQMTALIAFLNSVVDGFNTLSEASEQDVTALVAQFETLQTALAEVKTETIPTNLIAILQGWLADGTLEALLGTSLLDRERVYAAQFAIQTDGSDTTAAFIAAATFCHNHEKTLYLPSGTYLVSGTHEIPGCSLSGEASGGVNLILDGNISFLTDGLDALLVENITFTLRNNALDDADLLSDRKELFFATTPKTFVTYRNLSFLGEVTNTNGSMRYKGAIREGCTNGGLFDTLVFENIASCLKVLDDSSHYKATNLTATNFETLVWAKGTYYNVENITGTNTLAQMLIWLQKNHATQPQTTHNGLDLVLCEGSNYNLKNLKGVNCIERIVYSQGSDVTADNLWGSNSDGFKFVGVDKNTLSSNIHISNTWFEVNTDLVALGRSKVNEFTFYWAKNITVENTISSDGTASGTNPIRSIVNVYRYVKNLTLKNMFATYTENAFLYVALQNAAEFNPLYPTPTDADFMVLDTCTIQNCSVKKNSRRNGSLLTVRTAEADATILTKTGLQNISILDSKVSYGATKDDFLYDWSYCNGFYAKNNRADSVGYWNSGLPNTAPPVCTNIVLKESELLFSNLDALITQLGVIPLTKGSLLTLQTQLADRSYQITLTVDNNTQSTQPVLINQGSHLFCSLFLDGAYLSLANFPLSYLMESQNNAGGFHVQQVVDGVSTPLLGTSFFTATTSPTAPTLILRGDQAPYPLRVKINAMLGS